MSKRAYHKWTEQETILLYKTVISSDRNWRMVERAFPDFSLLQLQNKFTILDQQYNIKNMKNNLDQQKQHSQKTYNNIESLKHVLKRGWEIEQQSNTSLLSSETVITNNDRINLHPDIKERAYHHWTNEETLLLYKTVQKNRNNWKEVMKALPQFSLLQLQNKYVMIQKQFKLRTKNKQGLDEYDNQNTHQNDLVISDDTLQVLLDLISKKV
ncbi:Myb-like_DNA-binding domain-containing protein [Hexamita inflata]|uniref:Myb-like DNA-binding domain-containing protein n=1 Tax=Hexamita inflata TaxID=28002 RepID=A0AA86US94_9EUKA|nr:Myb-like DNA-binding domain-containing protein [Hexamita inflata]